MHKKIASSLLAAVLMAGLSGCALVDAAGSPTEAAAPSTTPAPSTPEVPDEVNGLPVKGLANDGKGDYLQTTLDKDDPSLDYDPSIIHSSALELFSKADIEDGQEFAMYFAAEEFMDSTLNGNPSDPEESQKWWDDNEDTFHSEYRDDVERDFGTAMIIIRGTLREPHDLSYGPDKGHVLSRELVPVEIFGTVYEGQDLLVISADFEVEHALVLDGVETPDPVSGTVKLLLAQEDSGEWKIAGTDHVVVMTPLK